MCIFLTTLFIFGTLARVVISDPCCPCPTAAPVAVPTAVPIHDCTIGTITILFCHFSMWSSWDCSSCCVTNAMSQRSRLLCCGGSLTQSDPNLCYSTCGKNYGVDDIDMKPCSTVCTCTTSSMSTLSTTASSTASTSTASSSSSSSTSSTATSSTASSTTSTPWMTTSTALSLSVSTSTRSPSLLCYEAKDDIYNCRSECEHSAHWDECIRSCSKDLYLTVCRIVSISLFVLGVIVGTLVTCIVNVLCKKRQGQRSVSPKSLGLPDRSLTIYSDDSELDDQLGKKEEALFKRVTNPRVTITDNP